MSANPKRTIPGRTTYSAWHTCAELQRGYKYSEREALCRRRPRRRRRGSLRRGFSFHVFSPAAGARPPNELAICTRAAACTSASKLQILLLVRWPICLARRDFCRVRNVFFCGQSVRFRFSSDLREGGRDAQPCGKSIGFVGRFGGMLGGEVVPTILLGVGRCSE